MSTSRTAKWDRPISNQGGWSREITQRELPIATTLAGVNMYLTPVGVRLTPRDLVRDNLHVGPELLNRLRKEKWPVVKYPGKPY